MRLFQPFQHGTYGLAGLIHGAGLFDLGQHLIVDGLPVQSAELGIPVLVAHGFPDIFEGIEIQLAFAGRYGVFIFPAVRRGGVEDRGRTENPEAKELAPNLS